jgi:hypothetical protein
MISKIQIERRSSTAATAKRGHCRLPSGLAVGSFYAK